jgi:hypothetical protein
MMTVAVETRIAFSAHAVNRYRERAYAAGDVARARAHLENLVPAARIASLPPGWFALRAKEDAELYLTIGADLVFPLVRAGEDRLDAWVAKTCIARGGMSDEARRRRNASNAMRRRSRREKRSGAARHER